MLNFTELDQVRQQAKTRDQDRLAQAKAAYAKAMRLLGQYSEQPSRELMKQSVRQLKSAIGLARTYLPPYIALGNLYMGMQQPALAMRYLKAAQELEPGSEYVLKLQQLLMAGKLPIEPEPEASGSESGSEAIESLAPGQGPMDYDALYDAVARRIQTELTTVMNMVLPPQPGIDQDVLLQLEQSRTGLAMRLDQILAHLQVIETDIDTSELKRQLVPIERRLSQIERLYDQCRTFSDLHGRIQALLQTVQKQLQILAPDENLLETFLDRCDAFADEIDYLDSKGLPVKPLVSVYHELTAAVTHLQDHIDDKD